MLSSIGLVCKTVFSQMYLCCMLYTTFIILFSDIHFLSLSVLYTTLLLGYSEYTELHV